MSDYNINYSLYLPSYSIGPDCYKEIPHVTRFFGKTAAVIGGKTAMAKAKKAMIDGVAGSDVKLLDFIEYGGDSTYENGDALIAKPTVRDADMIFAVGGGAHATRANMLQTSLTSRCSHSRPSLQTAHQ